MDLAYLLRFWLIFYLRASVWFGFILFLFSYVGDPQFARDQTRYENSVNHARSVYALRRALAEQLGICTQRERGERAVREGFVSAEGPAGDSLFLRLIHQRTGRAGKAAEAALNHTPVIIDDRGDIVREADKLGILAYQVGGLGAGEEDV